MPQSRHPSARPSPPARSLHGRPPCRYSRAWARDRAPWEPPSGRRPRRPAGPPQVRSRRLTRPSPRPGRRSRANARGGRKSRHLHPEPQCSPVPRSLPPRDRPPTNLTHPVPSDRSASSNVRCSADRGRQRRSPPPLGYATLRRPVPSQPVPTAGPRPPIFDPAPALRRSLGI